MESDNTKNKKNTKSALIIIFLIVLVALSAVASTLFYTRGFLIGTESRDAEKANIRQFLCIHSWNASSGTCIRCGLTCPHAEFDDNYHCKLCGFKHVHSYESSVCTECGQQCRHRSWINGYCEDCAIRCSHKSWDGNKCLICGITCDHAEYEDGICVICGYACPHEDWKDGKCVECSILCNHSDHDPDTRICNLCGARTVHSFIKGICACGVTPDFTTTPLPETIIGESAYQGKIETVSYLSQKYNDDNSQIVKVMDVYTPYGYDSNEKYDVLILIHGGSGTYSEWTTNPITVGNIMGSPRNIYDNMIDQKLCRPLIIVGISTFYSSDNGDIDSGFTQMAPEIRNDILPYIIEHYSTYAQNPTVEAIAAAREHFGIGGLSNGSLYAYNCGMIQNFDLFSNFVCLSGCSNPENYAAAIDSESNASLPVNCWYDGTGDSDTQRENCYNGYLAMTGVSPKLSENENSFFIEVRSAGHDWASFSVNIYNALLVLFNCS